MKSIESLRWRYATKKFDPSKKVAESDLEKIKEAIRLSPSSYGLQLFKTLIIKDPSLRAKLRKASWDQPQVVDASHLLVFCNYTDIKDSHIDEYLSLKASVQGMELSALKEYGDFIKSKLSESSAADKKAWTARQTYIALSNALSACAELKIDSAPMEGFEPEAYDKILKLNDKGLTTAVIMAIGYRSEEDQTQFAPKVRKPKEKLFETL